MIFVQSGVPAIAFTAELMPELMASITHTMADTPDNIDPRKLVEVARALESLILHL
jgi:aminopeptidase YwaD